MPPIRIAGALTALAVLALSACGQEAQVDPAQIDPRNPPPPGGTSTSTLTLPGQTEVEAPRTIVDIHNYLASGEAAGRRFDFPAVTFAQGMQVREDPDGALATLAAVLNAHPSSRVRVEVAMANPEQAGPSPAAEGRAALVAEALVRNGLSADRVTSAGVLTERNDRPHVQLVVTEK